MPNGCVHGAKSWYSHTQAPTKANVDLKPDSKAKPKAAGNRVVAAAVAIIAALSSMVAPSQALGTLRWAADTGGTGGRRLVSYEALRDPGFEENFHTGFAKESQENLRFSTGGGHKNSSKNIGFRDQGGFLCDANHFLLDSCPDHHFSTGLGVVASVAYDAAHSLRPYEVQSVSQDPFNQGVRLAASAPRPPL